MIAAQQHRTPKPDRSTRHRRQIEFWKMSLSLSVGIASSPSHARFQPIIHDDLREVDLNYHVPVFHRLDRTSLPGALIRSLRLRPSAQKVYILHKKPSNRPMPCGVVASRRTATRVTCGALSRHQKFFCKSVFHTKATPFMGRTIFGQVFVREGITNFQNPKVPPTGGQRVANDF
jgi:hypothetical protein